MSFFPECFFGWPENREIMEMNQESLIQNAGLHGVALSADI